MTDTMQELTPEAQLYIKLTTAMEQLKSADEAATGVDWFAGSKAAPHVSLAAQSLFVALDRLKRELVKRHGEDFENVLWPEPKTLAA